MDAKYELNTMIKCPICKKTIISTIYSYNEPFSEQDKIDFQKKLEEEHSKLHDQASDFIRLNSIVDLFIREVKGLK